MRRSLFEEFELSRLPVTDIITFDMNKMKKTGMDNLSEEIDKYVTNHELDVYSFEKIGEWNGEDITVPTETCYNKTEDKMFIRYDKCTNLKDALKFKEFMTTLFTRDTHIDKQTWMCNKEQIQQCFMLKQFR